MGIDRDYFSKSTAIIGDQNKVMTRSEFTETKRETIREG